MGRKVPCRERTDDSENSMTSAQRHSQWDSQRAIATPAQLTEAYFEPVMLVINAYVDNERQSRTYAESVFRLLDPRMCHTPIELFQVVTRFVLSLNRAPGLSPGLDRQQTVCLLFREIVQLDYADIAEVTQLTHDEVARAIAQARNTLLCTGA